MAKDFSTMELSNESANPSIHEQSLPSRRAMLSGGLAAQMSSVLPSSALLAGCATASGSQARSGCSFGSQRSE